MSTKSFRELNPEFRNTIISHDPATGEVVGQVPVATFGDVTEAIARSRVALASWTETSFSERARIMMAARRIILDELEEIAGLISRETGKPIAEAVSMELAPALDLMQFFARNTRKFLRSEKVDIGLYRLLGRSSKIYYKPVGVVGVISPWNFPWTIPAGEIVMALMAGNTVILKPSELTPMVGLKIGEVFNAAGLPANALQVLTGDGSTGAALAESGVDKIMFTGSVATGRKVAIAAAGNLTPVVLELGGKDPMIVLEDADLESAAAAAIWGAFSNSGQTCASVERCYVSRKVEAQFIDAVLRKTKSLRQRPGSDQDSDIGALSSERQLKLVDDQVCDAISRGANLLTGGRRASQFDGPFYEPTVMTGVDHSMPLMSEETFGPILPIMPFSSDDEVVRLANDSRFGLAASVWTRDIARGRAIAARIEAGTVAINEVLYTHAIAQTPWGGVKQSGIGRTHGRLGLMELVTPRHIHINRLGFIPDVWWFGYSPVASKLFRGMALRLASGSLLQTTLLLPQLIKRMRERKP